MQIVREIGGYSYGRSDLVRRAMSKKKHDVMQKERENFIYGIVDDDGTVLVEGAVRNGVDEKTANRIFDQMVDFASYAFNKSHAAAYAVVAFQTAWLKYYYPVEFMAALLNSFLGTSDKVSRYVQDCKQMGIEVLPPDVNESDVRFTVVNGKIRFGMAAVKNVGEGAVRELIRERNENGLFKSFGDFCERIGGKDFNKRCVESLIKCGAFDSFGVYRSKMMAVYEKLLEGAQQSSKSKVEGQLSLFELSGEAQAMKPDENYPDLNEFEPRALLAMEKEMLGLYVSGHPLDEYKSEIMKQTTVSSSDLTDAGMEGIEGSDAMMSSVGKNLTDGMHVTVGGIVTDKKTKATKNNNIMAFVTLEDLYGSMEIIVFPNVLIEYGDILVNDNAVFVDGRLSIREDEQPKIICESVRPIKSTYMTEAVHPAKTEKIIIRIDESQDSRKLQSTISLLKYFNGTTPVLFRRNEELGNISGIEEKVYSVNMCEALYRELVERFGKENVEFVSKYR